MIRQVSPYRRSGLLSPGNLVELIRQMFLCQAIDSPWGVMLGNGNCESCWAPLNSEMTQTNYGIFALLLLPSIKF